MKRFDCMKILASLLKDELIILCIGSSVDEWYTAAPHMFDTSLFQQPLGCATAAAFGLSVGLPHRKVISLDTDGGMFFNLGVLATLANEKPKNLICIVWDNECYLSIGGPPTHSAAGIVEISAIARGAGIENAYLTRNLDDFEKLVKEALLSDKLYVIVAKVDNVRTPNLIRKPTDGGEDTNRFVRYIEKSEGTSIMWPTEHN